MLSAYASKWWLGGLIALVLVSVCLDAQDQHREEHPKPARCQVSPVSTPDPEFPAIKDWKPVRVEAPTARLTIRQDGSVKSARLIRSSNVSEWDQVFLKAVKGWEFSKAPDCEVRKLTVSVDIHVR
jgi:TonB family protein